MIRALLLLLTFAASPALAQDGPRELTTRADLLGWEGVGRLDLGRAGSCTGVLVGPDLVLTAGHCLYAGDGAWRARDGMRFKAGIRNGDIIASRDVVQAVVHQLYEPEAEDPIDRYAHDIALLQLDAPIPAGTARPYRTESLVGHRAVGVVSYGTGRNAAPSRERTCTVMARQGGIALMDCDGVPGSSGAPVFVAAGGIARVAGLIVGGDRSGDRAFSLGVETAPNLPDLLADLRAGRTLWAETAPDARRLRPGIRNETSGARFVRP